MAEVSGQIAQPTKLPLGPYNRKGLLIPDLEGMSPARSSGGGEEGTLRHAAQPEGQVSRRRLSYLPPNPVLWEKGLTFRKSQPSRDIW